MKKIPITKPFFGPEEFDNIRLPLESGWVVQGPFVKQFEDKFSAFTGSRYSVATSSCTTALHTAVAALGLKPGDEVIVPAFTWVSTANVVEYMGATPVFCDIDLRTFNIDVEQIDALVTPRTVGIIPVHLFGLCAEMQSISELATRHHLWIIEDAACAFGAWYRGQHAGSFGDFGAFSFHPRKSITTGEGGMLTTQRRDYDQLARALRDHGASTSDLERHTGKRGNLLSEYDVLGFNYRMTDLQGALGCAQMDRAEWILQERARCAGHYDEMLFEFPWLTTPTRPDDCRHGYQSYVCLYCPEEPSLPNVDRMHEERNRVMDQMQTNGIATRQGTHAPVRLGYYAHKYGFRREQFPHAYIADRLTLSLPLYVQLTEAEQDFIVGSLQSSFATANRSRSQIPTLTEL